MALIIFRYFFESFLRTLRGFVCIFSSDVPIAKVKKLEPSTYDFSKDSIDAKFEPYAGFSAKK